MANARQYSAIDTGLPNHAEIPSFGEPPFPSLAKQIQAVRVVDRSADPESFQNTALLVHQLHLFPWQVSAVMFIVMNLRSTIGSCMLADGPRLGKTVSVLVAILKWAEYTDLKMGVWRDLQQHTSPRLINAVRRMQPGRQNNPDPRNNFPSIFLHAVTGSAPVHRPILVVVPSHARSSWIRDIHRFFSRTDPACSATEHVYDNHPSEGSNRDTNQLRHGRLIRLFHIIDPLQADQIGVEQTSIIPKNAASLKTFIAGLDPRDFMTTRTVILTTFETWHEVSSSSNSRNDRSGQRTQIKGSEFAIVVIGHAHRLRYSGSAITESLCRLEDTRFILTSSTPFSSGLKDFATYLRFLHKFSRHRALTLVNDEPPATAAYCRETFNGVRATWASRMQALDDYTYSEPRPIRYLHALEPENFKRNLSDDIRAAALPINMTLMRRVEGQHIKLSSNEEAVIDVASQLAKPNYTDLANASI